MSEHSPTPDQAARDRIRTALNETLFVEAGAGSGKTTALVERIVAMVRSGVAITEIAAITFTEKAAGELRHRVRELLTKGAEGSDREARACQAALGDVDRAAIGTLHAFAQRILSEYPIEAGLPPRIEVLDEIGSQLMFESRWRDDLDALLQAADDDRELADVLLYSRAANVRRREFRQLQLALGRDTDLVEVWLPPTTPTIPQLDTDEISRALRRLIEASQNVIEAAPDDRLVQHLIVLEPLADRLDEADNFTKFALLRATKFESKLGRAPTWKIGLGKDAVVEALADLGRDAAERTDRIVHACLEHLAVVFGRLTLHAANERKRQGRLEFHDLLVLARGLLRSPDYGQDVRLRLHKRWPRLLLDEFQDTDPIQLELASLISTDPARDAADWEDLPPESGHLFIVGDPKQSIYRFRRADIGLFLRAREKVTDEVMLLTTNFRTTAPVINWINEVFGQLIQHKVGAQPAFVALHSDRLPATIGAPVTLFGRETSAIAEDIRAEEAADLAATIISALAWTVKDSDGGWRTARYGDMAILLPTRISLPAIETALSAANIPYRAESSSLVYATREIRDLLLAASAIDDPSDELALVAALRSPLFGCSDIDLALWRQRGGRFNLLASRRPDREADEPDIQDIEDIEEAPDEGGAVHDALAYLRELHDQRHWLSPAQLLERLVDDRRVSEVALAGPRALDVWRRVRFVIDQARAWSTAGGRGLRSYLGWCTLQGREGTYAGDAALAEHDDDAVRIMTIHAAKGLEFPITMVAGLSTRRSKERQGVSVRWHHGRPEIRIRNDVSTSDYDDARDLDDQMDHEERLRLLYVACTRAMDHLVVSLHRKSPPKKGFDEQTAPLAALLAIAARYEAPPMSTDSDAAPTVATVEAIDEAPNRPAAFDRASWAAGRQLLLQRALEPSTVSPSRLAGFASDEDEAPGLQKDARPLDLPPWNRGRYGTAIGRAVHGVLQRVDLGNDAEVDSVAAAQAAAEGVLGQEAIIASLTRSALASPTVKAASRLPHWREMFVGTLIGDRVLEGYIDLLYRTPEGYIVVDYKTDAVADGEVDDRVSHYRLQGAAYAVAVSAIVNEPVIECRFVFCRPDVAVERSLPQLSEAMDEVRSRLLGPRVGVRHDGTPPAGPARSPA
jgi:ATP-dependent helicase/nuclease subunit A